MLASLLPGLRDLRTPLAVGYLWLVVLWLWFRDHLPRKAEARGAIGDVYDLAEVLPGATTFAALTFVAYFLGSIVELDVSRLHWLDVINRNKSTWEAVSERFRTRLEAVRTLSRDGAAAEAWRRAAPIRTVVRVSLDPGTWSSEVQEGPAKGPSVRHLPDSHISIIGLSGFEPSLFRLPMVGIAALYALQDEVPDLATRLLIERPEVFDRYDRLLAEASIRINMFPPLVALVATMAVRAHWLWWLGLIVCAGWLYQGLLKRSRAIAVVLDSVATRLIESPTMQAIEAAYAEPTSASQGVAGLPTSPAPPAPSAPTA